MLALFPVSLSDMWKIMQKGAEVGWRQDHPIKFFIPSFSESMQLYA